MRRGCPATGITGWTAALSIPMSSSTTSTRTPDSPTASALARSRSIAAHDVGRQRLADAGGVRTHEVALELGGAGRVDPDVGQVAEAGCHAVGGGALGDETLDHGPRRAHAVGSVRIESDGAAAAGDLDDLVDGEVPAGEEERRHRSLYYAPCDGCRTP
jgi:hypothetical protein